MRKGMRKTKSRKINKSKQTRRTRRTRKYSKHGGTYQNDSISSSMLQYQMNPVPYTV